jgi:hypothetical protein
MATEQIKVSGDKDNPLTAAADVGDSLRLELAHKIEQIAARRAQVKGGLDDDGNDLTGAALVQQVMGDLNKTEAIN